MKQAPVEEPGKRDPSFAFLNATFRYTNTSF